MNKTTADMMFGDAALDHTGAMHLVFVDNDNSGDPFVRYLKLGPVGP